MVGTLGMEANKEIYLLTTPKPNLRLLRLVERFNSVIQGPVFNVCV